MPYALNLTLDPAAADRIERVYARLAELDIPDGDLVTQYGPCVTVMIVKGRLAPDIIARTLELRLPMLAAVPVRFIEPCIILGSPPTLSLRVSATPSLLELHHTLFSEFQEDDVHLHYRPAYWQPHLKLAKVRENQKAASKLVAALAAGWHELSGVLDRLEVMQYSPVQSIWQAPLRASPSIGGAGA